ncbi:unnamed protein product [Macrosiphum euphorbiae]|uniref:Uncharacterized protein n=1 Tax=Macrosiphum euphorbiae TaxID=13131 RepID=A0AAV0X9K1_9HEMI|nr:unnamed protein product [Macrosiphum euphorbiae]
MTYSSRARRRNPFTVDRIDIIRSDGAYRRASVFELERVCHRPSIISTKSIPIGTEASVCLKLIVVSVDQ